MKEKKDRVDDARALRVPLPKVSYPRQGGIHPLPRPSGQSQGRQRRRADRYRHCRACARFPAKALWWFSVRDGKEDFGYNARTDTYENLLAAGVIDPAKVTRVALENAASIAGMFLTTECVIAEKKEDTPAAPAPGMVAWAA